MWRRVVRWGLLAFAALTVVCVARGVMLSPPPVDAGPAVQLPDIDRDAAVERLSGAVRIATVSIKEGRGDPQTFRELHAYLRRSFPRVHETLQVETVAEHSLVYRWEGRDPNELPVLLLAHMDVVPVEPGTEGDWQQAPFSGDVVDGEVWGRGTMDDKAALMGILEAVEALLIRGHTPQRTVILAFGHDEEIGGDGGAKVIAERFTDAGLRFEMILDEGGAVITDSIPGLIKPAALVGIAEKGYASLKLTAPGEGGHSSMPHANGAIPRLARAVRLVDQHQMPARLDGPTRMMLDTLGPHMPALARIAFANVWVLEPVIVRVMLSRHTAAASVRTTTAPTIFQAGSADNVIPQKASAVINFRLLPGDTIDSLITHVRAVVGDPAIDVKCADVCREASSPSRVDGPQYAALRSAILHTFPDAVVAPYLVVGGTDAQHYQHLSDATYRFLPLLFRQSEASRLHGTGERIAVDAYARAIRFYLEVILRAGDLE